MTRVTTDGLEMRDRCPALTSVMWAPARWLGQPLAGGGLAYSVLFSPDGHTLASAEMMQINFTQTLDEA